VAKILVADDNSNIQKMVGLALKDQGIDVVAVGAMVKRPYVRFPILFPTWFWPTCSCRCATGMKFAST